jgi:hypothetical protein
MVTTAAERASWASDGPVEEEDDAERACDFNPKQASLIICDEDPTVEPARILVR